MCKAAAFYRQNPHNKLGAFQKVIRREYHLLMFDDFNGSTLKLITKWQFLLLFQALMHEKKIKKSL